MKNLLLLLTLFISLIFSASSVNAERQYYSYPTCSIFPECPDYLKSFNLGLPTNPPLNTDNKKTFLDSACQYLSQNENSTYINTWIDWSEYIAYTINPQNPMFYWHAQGNKIGSLTCDVPPPPVPGCTDKTAINYNPSANQDDWSCTPKIEGCTDSTAINYNPNANVHIEASCQYPPTYTPQDITGYFTQTQVQSGATTWTMTLNVNLTGAILNPSSIQTWNHFTAISTQTDNKTITITFRQFDDQRLNVECNNYEVTIPKNAITTTQGDKNINLISGNFSVVGCPEKTDTNTQENTATGSIHENTIKKDNYYLSLYDTDENWKIYLNLTNIVYFIWFISFFFIVFFVLFWFIKNSFLWKSKKSFH